MIIIGRRDTLRLSLGPVGFGGHIVSFVVSIYFIFCHPLHFRLFTSAFSMSLLAQSLDRNHSCECIILMTNNIAYVLYVHIYGYF